MLPIDVSAFLDTFTQWIRSQPDVKAVALVGSHARGAATEAVNYICAIDHGYHYSVTRLSAARKIMASSRPCARSTIAG